jgi:hypothetical protein
MNLDEIDDDDECARGTPTLDDISYGKAAI